MAELVHILCACTSLVCAALLARGYQQSRKKLLFWSSLCFGGLAVNNVLAVIDFRADVDLALYRPLTGLISIAVLVFALVWESK
jgi:heme A synthase